ncbi:LuxR C-terminal-related transcriptional regulator [Rhodococcus chondri]|uniref:LuxR C-terminal-related transcriptional regulator n=1 Tax=Rhodococcus chondri TaxID=3065941 RepID=A0ABU7JSC9_9NOCA|nr:LuxR C-terminal-related transcriptional regulator [Rhodococcus sp. CC-R104]MEE2032943.1 LuxR C-terminal-related transcriptional regulator [Rhodococcus sp. CC-R104]
MDRAQPLIQRQRELAAITRALTTDGESRGVVLTGAAGVGKTTLARFATGSLPGTVRWVAGTESARSIPLGVFAHLVVGSTTSRDPVNFLAAAREALLADGDDLVIGVDDAHLLDQLSATFLHQLALDGKARIVATVRSGESVPDAVTSLWKDGYLQRLELEPFTREQSVAYVESVLGGPLEELSADRMWEASGGNALFLKHLVEGALEAGTLSDKRGVWQLRGRAAITSELAALLESRIAQLPDDVLRCLQLLAFCEPIDLDVLASVAGEESIEEAERRGLVRVHEDGIRLEVRYAHPLFSEVIRRGLGRAAARRLRGILVEALQSSDLSTVSSRIRLTELALDSDRPPDTALLLSSARSAIGFADSALGERFARAAVQRGGGFDAAQLLGRTLFWLGKSDEDEALLTEFDPDALDQRELATWGMVRFANLFFGKGDVDSAEEVLGILRERVTEPSLALTIRALGAGSAVAQNRLAEGLSEAQAVLARPDLTPWAVEWATYAQLWVFAVSGSGDIAGASARNDAVAGKVDGLFRYMAGLASVRALILTGQFDAAERRAQRFLDNASSLEYLAWGQASVVVADMELVRGRIADAARRLEQAVAALSVGPSTNAIAWIFPAYYPLIQAYSLLGRVTDAEAVLDAAETRYGGQVAVHRPHLDLARGWVFAARGETSRAVELAREAARAASVAGQFGVEALALHTATRFGDSSGAGRLAQLVECCDGPLVRLAAAQAAAAESGDFGELMRVAGEYERIGVPMEAADAYALAATAAKRAGHRGSGLAAAAAADALAARCDHASTPAVTASAQPLPLTSREREIASMVAAGLTNREIADRLVVSVRTVEGHIYRACLKLDVTDRARLAEVLRSAR